MNDKKAFLVYTEWLELIEVLPEDEQLILFKRMFKYERGDSYISTVSRPLEKMWKFIKKKLDENDSSWEDERQKRIEAGRLGGIKSGESRRSKRSTASDNEANEAPLQKMKQDEANEAVNVNVNVNENVNENVNVNKKESTREKRFKKPTIDEIEQYILDMGYSVDAETFFDFYEAKGWRVGKDSMKDWKAAVRTWQKRTAKPVNDFLTAFDRGELT